LNEAKAVCCVIGDPVSHSFSPQIHSYFAASLGLPLSYTAFHVKPEGLADAIKGAHALGIKGINVTVPHKTEVIPHLAQLSEDASLIGAVNTLALAQSGYAGSNTDWIGMKMALESEGVSLEGKSVAVIGAGGSARAACLMASRCGAKEISFANRTLSKAEELCDLAEKCGLPGSFYPLSDIMDIEGRDIVIQTTTVGFGKNQGVCPAPPEFLEKSEIALDIIYAPWETEFLKTAKRFCKAINGFTMLVCQAAASFETWFGVKLSGDFLRQAVQDLSKEYRCK
jgi:shikimate dehydrogenase